MSGFLSVRPWIDDGVITGSERPIGVGAGEPSFSNFIRVSY